LPFGLCSAFNTTCKHAACVYRHLTADVPNATRTCRKAIPCDSSGAQRPHLGHTPESPVCPRQPTSTTETHGLPSAAHRSSHLAYVLPRPVTQMGHKKVPAVRPLYGRREGEHRGAVGPARDRDGPNLTARGRSAQGGAGCGRGGGRLAGGYAHTQRGVSVEPRERAESRTERGKRGVRCTVQSSAKKLYNKLRTRVDRRFIKNHSNQKYTVPNTRRVTRLAATRVSPAARGADPLHR
jgi:hypothetical protein